MHIARGLFFFYKKITLPALLLSILLSLFGMDFMNLSSGVGISFMFLLPLFHFLSYEIRYANEYYFYHNLGLSRLILWIYTILIGFIVGLMLILI